MMKNAVPHPGQPFDARPRMPASSKTPFFGAELDATYARLSGGLSDIGQEIHDLLQNRIHPVAATLTRTLRELVSDYMPEQGLSGTLHYEQNLPDIDVPDAPLRAVLEHLVEGALRGNPSVKPFCHVGAVSDQEDKVVLCVRDNGTPLPQCSMDDMRRFLRDTEPRHVPDRVHRLFLAENLVQWLGGKVSIAATPGASGTTVLIELPRQASANGAEGLVGRHVF